MDADWLIERGDPRGDPRGELIQLQCEISKLPVVDPRDLAIRERAQQLVDHHGHTTLLTATTRAVLLADDGFAIGYLLNRRRVKPRASGTFAEAIAPR